MYLEDIIKTYGMVSYYDHVSDRIYDLSEAKDEGDTWIVPVYGRESKSENFDLAGYVTVAKVE